MSCYPNIFLPDKTIVGTSGGKQDSILCREWLNHSNSLNICREVPICIKTVENVLKIIPTYDGEVSVKCTSTVGFDVFFK